VAGSPDADFLANASLYGFGCVGLARVALVASMSSKMVRRWIELCWTHRIACDVEAGGALLTTILLAFLNSGHVGSENVSWQGTLSFQINMNAHFVFASLN
jgi:hypothetical protein